MKFLPPAAALQLTQKSSKALENAAASAESAAQGVISAQDLVSGCKKALAAAEHACSNLIEEKGSTDEELLTFTHFAQYFAQRAQVKHAESARLGERLQQQQGIVAQQTQEVDNAETAAAVAIDDCESAVKKLASAQRALEDAKGKQQHSLQVTASPSVLPETKNEPSSPDGRPALDATKLNGKHRSKSRSKSPYSSSSKASSRSRSRSRGKKRARSPERASRRSRRSPSRSRRRSSPRKRTPPRRSRSRPRRSSPHRRASSPISFRQRNSLRRDSKRSPPRRRRARSRSRMRSPVRRRVSSRGRSPIPLRPGQRRPSDLRIDENTRALFLQGLKTVLRRKRTPFNISLINDVMRAEDRRWNVRVAFDVSFAVLCQKFELDKEIVLGYSGDSVMIDSAPKYEVDRRSLSPVKRGGRSISPVRRSKASLSPVPRRGGKSVSPPLKRRSISPVKRPARSPSPVRARRRSPSPPPRRRRRSLTPPRRRSLSPPGAAGDRWVMR
ncbi:hypothetical protein WJX79_003633 [Trebouxia sp. C0005]